MGGHTAVAFSLILPNCWTWTINVTKSVLSYFRHVMLLLMLVCDSQIAPAPVLGRFFLTCTSSVCITFSQLTIMTLKVFGHLDCFWMI